MVSWHSVIMHDITIRNAMGTKKHVPAAKMEYLFILMAVVGAITFLVGATIFIFMVTIKMPLITV